MNTDLYSKLKNIIALIVLLLSLPANAQDTIFCPDDKYYWNGEPCNGGYMSPTFWSGSSNNYCPLTDKELTRPAILKEIILPEDTEMYIYGVAGTTIGCNNPNGCYFYICRKVNGQFEILDSAMWSHKTDYDYIHYCNNMTDGDSLCNSRFMATAHYENMVVNNGISAFDTATNSFPVFEAYFTNPIAVVDTFYIGMNSNGILAPMYHQNAQTLYPNNSDRKNYSFIVTKTSSRVIPNVIYCSWIHAPFDNINRRIWEQNIYFNGFFPIMKAHLCPQVVDVYSDSLTSNSVYIEWNEPYASSFFRLEYGIEGFTQGNGTIIDSINSTNITINDLMPNTRYEVYIQSYCVSNDTSSNWTGISFHTLDTTCAVVENFDTVYVRDTRAKVSWNITSSEITCCEIEFGESGFEQGQGNYVRNIEETSYFFRNLTVATTYDVYIRTYCQRSDLYSSWEKITFTTQGIGINEVKPEIPITLQPNPTEGIVEVSLPQEYENHLVELYDLQGKLLQTNTLQAGKTVFNLSSYPNGVYVIKVGETSKQVVKGKY